MGVATDAENDEFEVMCDIGSDMPFVECDLSSMEIIVFDDTIEDDVGNYNMTIRIFETTTDELLFTEYLVKIIIGHPF